MQAQPVCLRGARAKQGRRAILETGIFGMPFLNRLKKGTGKFAISLTEILPQALKKL